MTHKKRGGLLSLDIMAWVALALILFGTGTYVGADLVHAYRADLRASRHPASTKHSYSTAGRIRRPAASSSRNTTARRACRQRHSRRIQPRSRALASSRKSRIIRDRILATSRAWRTSSTRRPLAVRRMPTKATLGIRQSARTPRMRRASTTTSTQMPSLPTTWR